MRFPLSVSLRFLFVSAIKVKLFSTWNKIGNNWNSCGLMPEPRLSVKRRYVWGQQTTLHTVATSSVIVDHPSMTRCYPIFVHVSLDTVPRVSERRNVLPLFALLLAYSVCTLTSTVCYKLTTLTMLVGGVGEESTSERANIDGTL